MRARHVTYVAAFMFIVAAGQSNAAMTISSTDIKDGGIIPATHIYTRCGGQNVSPALS